MEGNYYPGQQVLLILACGDSLEGCVKFFNKNTRKLTVCDLVRQPCGTKVHGVRHLFPEDVRSVRVLQTDLCEFGASVDVANEAPKVVVGTDEYNSIKELQKNFRYINNLTTNFYSAIEALNQCKKVGLWADTPEGRRRRASGLALSTEKEIFVFDLNVFGDSGLEKGLRGVLESETIVKVVYDCRMLSDCLKHRHVTTLTNVRDVEAEDVLLVYQTHGLLRKKKKAFSVLVEEHLGVPTVDPGSGQCDKEPLSIVTQQNLAMVVSLLLPLHKFIKQKFKSQLNTASAMYCSKVRDLDGVDASNETKVNKYTLYKDLIPVVRSKPKPIP